MRTAVCLHGYVGNIVGKSGDSIAGAEEVLRHSFRHWNDNIFKYNNCDVFIHCWNVDLKKEIVSLFNPKKYEFEEQKTFEIPKYVPGEEKRKQNHYSRWYSLKQSVKMKNAYAAKNNITYDCVMCSRFDIAWKEPIFFDEHNMKYFYSGGWYRKNNSKLKDFFFFSSSENMNKFSKLYYCLDEYNNPKRHDTFGRFGISNHKLAKYHGDALKFKYRYVLSCDDDINPDLSDYPLVRYAYYNTEI